ncbi:MAG: 1,4-dihydroxy-2-naphthoate octaprenyltransferase [Deltaproteobacteria bacterium]|nr:1,4-dihydroxy-2-naphthoate octaprenyltransferase [Deltaproteobacteria bacterium]MBW1928144.1 1,4-dihydroxy-2-naphthoate octaprenyltransferase [Deltaproteobacteria bacterium]MBW2025662.1 1,4-dihydroxy-2-naphthoate octaprenyltransferase [Deltaproteobacteria bacterium]MBW2125636.1 1,4-dihydroxy-2-naphthoate octaprenyltransferase [Deltaproteobacteria bacterium]
MIASYLKALRAPFLAGSIVPVLIGASDRFSTAHVSFVAFLVTLGGVVFLHLGGNLINDYYDARGSDPVNLKVTPFSGGSRVIQDKEVGPTAILILALCFFCLALACGIWLTFKGRGYVMVIGVAGLVAGWIYSGPPLQLMSKGWGEILIFLAFGPLITFGTYYALSGDLSMRAFLLGVPQGFLITGVIWINEFPDYEADKQVGKQNLVVRLGLEKSRYLYAVIMLLSFVCILVYVIASYMSYLALVAFFSLPFALKAIHIAWHHYGEHDRIIPAQALTIQTLIVQGLLLSGTLALSKWF